MSRLSNHTCGGNRKKCLYLGIETSCDETAAAVVSNGRHILSNIVASQAGTHQAFGGVVPEIAAREHLDAIIPTIHAALQSAEVAPEDLGGIAYTTGPGLIGSLLVGAGAAKTLSYSWDKPLIAVDHLDAHVGAAYLESTIEPPFVALLVSGGHSQLLHIKSFRHKDLLGQSLDDAAGEAFDKAARLLSLGYPGGPAIDRAAKLGNMSAFRFPEARVNAFDFSFSGLKTAFLRTVEKLKPPLPVEDLCASFQETIVTTLAKKAVAAQRHVKAPCIVVVGGVSANSRLRATLQEVSAVPVYFPPTELCTDNAAMVAGSAFFCGTPVDFTAPVYSRHNI